MPLSEFELIARYFRDQPVEREDVVQGIGDDCAEVTIADGHEMLVDVSCFAEGGHFQAGDDPAGIGHRALAYALTRLAACGAEPAWLTLALTLPRVDEQWLRDFSGGLLRLAQRHRVALVGGDTTRGPLTVGLQLHGLLPMGSAVPANGARPGDLLYIIRPLGAAGLAVLSLAGELQLPIQQRQDVLEWLYHPEPPVAAAAALRGLAHGACPLADGLAQSLAGFLDNAGVGATVQVQRLPLSPAVEASFDQAGGWNLPLHGQDPCGLCIAVPAERQAEWEQRLAAHGLMGRWVGIVEPRPGLRCVLDDGTEI